MPCKPVPGAEGRGNTAKTAGPRNVNKGLTGRSALSSSPVDVVKSLPHAPCRRFPDHGNRMTLDEVKGH